ncbi:MAG: hypothetical protein ACRDHE_04545 [Ktedonobacterales bacterium]
MVERRFGFVYLGSAVMTLVFALVTWAVGRLTPFNTLIYALAAVGLIASAVMALRGDYPSARMDEGQRESWRQALSDAFYVGYIGLCALFLGSVFFTISRAATQDAIGVLLLLMTLTWAGAYMWRRWRP